MNTDTAARRSPRSRSRALMLALGLTLGAVAWVAARDDAGDAGDGLVAAPARARATAAAPFPGPGPGPKAVAAAASTAAPWPAAPAGRASGSAAPATVAWGTVPPPPAAPAPVLQRAAVQPAPAAPPQAPAFPYTWIGRVDDGAQPQALLEGPNRTLSVRPRDVIDGQWRVDAVDAQGVRLTWLPTGQPVQVARPLS